MSRLDCCSLTRAIMTQLRDSGEFDSDEQVVHHIIESRDNDRDAINRPINLTINITINKKDKNEEDLVH